MEMIITIFTNNNHLMFSQLMYEYYIKLFTSKYTRSIFRFFMHYHHPDLFHPCRCLKMPSTLLSQKSIKENFLQRLVLVKWRFFFKVFLFFLSLDIPLLPISPRICAYIEKWQYILILRYALLFCLALLDTNASFYFIQLQAKYEMEVERIHLHRYTHTMHHTWTTNVVYKIFLQVATRRNRKFHK